MKKFVSMVLAVLMLCSGVTTYADADDVSINDDATLFFAQVNYITVSFRIESGIAKCAGIVTPQRQNDTSITVYLKQEASPGWTNFAQWSSDGSTLSGASCGGEAKVTHGYNYKVVAVGKVLSNTGVVLETVTKESVIKYY